MPDDPRLLAEATAAFIDGTPIDWSALLSRVRTSPDRALFENLHTLSALRRKARAASGAAQPHASAAAWVVVALSAVETSLLVVLLASAFIRGESMAGRAPQLILALAFAASSVRLGVGTFRDPRSLFLLATFTGVAGTFAHSAARGLTAPWSVPIDSLLKGVWIDPLLPVCLWQFALGFPRVRRFTRFDRFARVAVAALWVLGILLFAFNIVVTRLDINTGPFAYLSPDHSNYLSWRLFSLSMTGALLAILVRARRAPARERRKVARLARAIGIGLGPFLLFGVVRTAVPAVEEWFRTPGAWGAVWLYGLIVAALAATPVLSTAAILVDRLFDLGAGARRHGGWLSVFASRLSSRAVHDDGRVARALERLSRARGTREAIAALSHEIVALAGAKSVGILLPEQDGGFVQWSNAGVRLRPNSGLAALLREVDEPLDVSATGPLLTLLPRNDRDWVAANAVHLIATLKRRDGGIAAVVIIGPKRNGVPFGRRDTWLTVALMAATAAAFDDDSRWRDPSQGPGLELASAGEAAFECPLCGIVGASSPLSCGCGGATTLAALPYSVADTFRVQRRVGAGGMGVVYLARDAVLDRDVALKTLPCLRPRAVERLRDEARAMAALNHESLATIYGLEIWRGTPILVVEYFPNGTLASRLSRGRLSPEDTVALGIRLARALVYMHARAVLHRDLKPSNIAFTASGGAKLLDFGLATLSTPDVDDEPSDRVGTTGEPFIGTRAYASPETLQGEPSSSSGDRWALAVVLMEAACGANPFATSHRRATRRDATRADLPEACSATLRTAPELRAFLERALAPSPEHRFRTTGDFLAGLEDIAAAPEWQSRL